MTHAEGEGFVIREQVETRVVLKNDVTGLTRYETRRRMVIHPGGQLPILWAEHRRNTLPFLQCRQPGKAEPLRDPRMK